MIFPRLNIYLNRITGNASKLLQICSARGINAGFVTKVFGSDERIIRVLDKLDFAFFADSRLMNLKNIKSDKPKMLLRLPALSQIEETVRFADISLNSELEIIVALNKYSESINKKHGVILMVDIGDLREGIFYKDKGEIYKAVNYIKNAGGLTFTGIGTNLTCYGSIIPTKDIMEKLVGIKHDIERECGVEVDMVSGGNSSGVNLIKCGEMPKEINSMRLGECMALGTEAAYGTPIDGCRQDTFTLEAEVIELKEKPSMPEGEKGYNAFHKKIDYIDKGQMIRAICAIGEQDVDTSAIKPVMEDVEVLGASSDHLILEIAGKAKEKVRLGMPMEFYLGYGALLRSYTSKYVYKNYIE